VTTTQELQQRWQSVMMPNYGIPPVALDHGQGVRVTDVDGVEYLDFISGIAVSSLGHAHPAIVAAVTRQVGRLAHTSNLFLHEPGLTLAERLLGLLGQPGHVFFANSGAEANECALKLTRKHGHALDPTGGRVKIVAANNGFHGRTLGALSITGTASKRVPFEPLPGPVEFIDYGDADALRAVVGADTAAVFLETTLGEGGIVAAPEGFLALARALCDEFGALLVIDEVQSGIGRTGQWFSSLAEGVRPDIITLAKGLGGGLPIGACIAVGDAANLFVTGDHGSTFGGNPVSCAAALAVLDTIQADGLLDSVKRVGAHLHDSLSALPSPLITDVRGTGLWQAVVLAAEVAGALESAAREQGLLVNAVKPSVIRLAPPLITTEADVDAAVAKFGRALEDVHDATLSA
jgi:acetylornithine/N-succinyldiaminopimelate aminotransferase